MKRSAPWIVGGLIVMLGGTSVLEAQSREVVAVITELKFNRGDIQIRMPGAASLERPAVLQSLYAGSQIQASKDAAAVILFTDGMKTVIVNEKNSPFEVKVQQGKDNQVTAWVKDVASSLVGKKKPPAYVPLAVRGASQPPTLLSPRNTKLMTEAPTLQWMGMGRQPGTVRVFGPEGVLWTAENVALTQLKYPPSAPRLRPNVEYFWAIEKKGFPAAKARFELLDPKRVRAINEKLAWLDGAEGLSKTTLAIIKAGLLISEELFYDAREILVEAANWDPDEPTLHFLLGEVYEKTRLNSLAAEEYDEAEFLAKKKP